MNTIGIIPVRMAASRFPGKPLAKILGIPMAGHVYFRSKMNRSLSEVYFATCDKEIEDYGRSIGAKVIMTKTTHQRASDRTAEAVEKIEKQTKKKVDVVVMIQGDEPMLMPEMIDLSLKPFKKEKGFGVINLMAHLESEAEENDPNEIKVVVDPNNFALYFSRRPIPFHRPGSPKQKRLKQVCIIPFKRDYLTKFNRLPSTPLEIAESVDMLRILEHGDKVKMVMSPYQTYSVDTPEDLRHVEGRLKNDPLVSRYR